VPIEQATGEQIGAFWRHYLIMLTGARWLSPANAASTTPSVMSSPPRPRDAPHPRGHVASLRGDLRTASRPSRAGMPRSHASSNTSTPSGAASIRSFCGCTGTRRRRAQRTSSRLARAPAVAAAATQDRRDLRPTVSSRDCAAPRRRSRRARPRDRAHHPVRRTHPRRSQVRRPPHPNYVLGRLAGDPDGRTRLEHVVPVAPSDDWSPDGIRRWADLSDDEQNSFRALTRRSAT
jgi:hypothetical protein